MDELSTVMDGHPSMFQHPSFLTPRWDGSEARPPPPPRICQQDWAQAAHRGNLLDNEPCTTFIVCFPLPASLPHFPTGASWDPLQDKLLALKSPCQARFGGKPDLRHRTPAKLDITSGFASWWREKLCTYPGSLLLFPPEDSTSVKTVCQHCAQASGQPQGSVYVVSEPGPHSPPFQGEVVRKWEQTVKACPHILKFPHLRASSWHGWLTFGQKVSAHSQSN